MGLQVRDKAMLGLSSGCVWVRRGGNVTSWLLVCVVHPPATPGRFHGDEIGGAWGRIPLALGWERILGRWDVVSGGQGGFHTHMVCWPLVSPREHTFGRAGVHGTAPTHCPSAIWDPGG